MQALQGEVRAKEIEMDALTDKAQNLYKGSSSPRRQSQNSELGLRYQQILARVKELAAKWQLHVTDHQEYQMRLSECQSWLADISQKLSYCSDLSASSQEDLETKMATVQVCDL
jgi:nesprin-1